MICPKCNCETPSDECIGCGVIISRYLQKTNEKMSQGKTSPEDDILLSVLSEIRKGFRTRLLVEKHQKSGIVAAILNLVFPGAGYWYAGRRTLALIIGVIALIVLIASFATFGIAWLVASPLWTLMAFDGFLQIDKFNKGILQRALDGDLV